MIIPEVEAGRWRISGHTHQDPVLSRIQLYLVMLSGAMWEAETSVTFSSKVCDQVGNTLRQHLKKGVG